jgi:hypothetical protein
LLTQENWLINTADKVKVNQNSKGEEKALDIEEKEKEQNVGMNNK